MNYSPAQIRRLESRITSALRPVIRASVVEYRRTHTSTSTLTTTTTTSQADQILSPAFENAVYGELRKEVVSAVANAASAYSAVGDEEGQVEAVMRNLRQNVVRRIVQKRLQRQNIYVDTDVKLTLFLETKSGEMTFGFQFQNFYHTNTYNTLVERLLNRIRASVVKAIREHNAEQQNAVDEEKVLAPEFTNEVSAELEREVGSLVRQVMVVSTTSNDQQVI